MTVERVVVLSGDIDIASRDETAERLSAGTQELDGHSVLVVDVSAVTFLDSTGLSCIAEADGAARAAGSTLRIRGASPMIARLFELTGLDGYLEDRT